jgi:hypothetical protein
MIGSSKNERDRESHDAGHRRHVQRAAARHSRRLQANHRAEDEDREGESRQGHRSTSSASRTPDSTDDIDHLEQSDAIERLDRELLGDEAQQARLVGKKRKKGRQFSDDRLYNPGGIRGDVGPAAR